MKETKQNYEEPIIELIRLESQDIVTASGDPDIEGGENDTPYIPIP